MKKAARRLLMEHGYNRRGSSDSAASEMAKEAAVFMFFEEK